MIVVYIEKKKKFLAMSVKIILIMKICIRILFLFECFFLSEVLNCIPYNPFLLD